MASYTGKCTIKILAAIASVVLVIGLLPTVALADTLEAPGEAIPDASPATVEGKTNQNGTSNPEGEDEPKAQLLSVQGEELDVEDSLLTAATETSGTCGDGVTWTLEGGVLAISGTGAMNDYDADNPSPWYDSKDSITSAVIGDGVTNIGAYAFYCCYGLTSVSIPDAVTSIEEFAFYGCDSLASVSIPNGVTIIRDDAFRGCTSLESLVIPASVTSIGGGALMYCNRLANVYYAGTPSQWDGIKSTFPGGTAVHYMCGDNLEWTLSNHFLSISTTGEGTGEMWNYSTSSPAPWKDNSNEFFGIVIGDGVTSIGAYAFRDCTHLLNFIIPASVTSIGDHALDGCFYLDTVTGMGGVESIGAGAFFGCTHLKDIVIPAGAKSIGVGAFCDCAHLEDIVIPASVTSIGAVAFDGCNRLANAYYAGSPANVGADAFPNTTAVHYMCGDNLKWTLDDGVLAISKLDPAGSGAMYDYNQPDDVPWYSQKSTITKVVIENGVTSIGEWAFYGCTCLKSVEIPEGVRTIGMGAFELCGQLSTISIPSSVTNIGEQAFASCMSLTRVDIPTGVETIEMSTFVNCDSLRGISIPSTVTSVGERAFENCTKFSTIDYGGSKSQWGGVTLGENWADSPGAITINYAKWDVTASVNPATGGKVEGADIYANSAMAKLKAIPYEGYEFVNWTKGGTVVSDKAVWEFEATTDRTLVANFKLKEYAITWEQDDGTLIEKTTVEHGKAPTHADPAKKADEKYVYEFTGWTPEIVAATGDATYKATYKAVEKYPCAEGSNQTWTKGSADPLTLRFKGATDDKATFDLFKGVEVDGKAVPEKDSSGNANWTASKGSLILSLQPSYLEALGDGNHTVKALFEDGAGETSFTIAAKAVPAPTPAADTTRPASSDTAKTGDTLPVTPVIAALLLSVCALVISKRKLQMVHPAYRGKHAR